MTELVARLNGNGSGLRIRGVFERLTWPIRKFVWKLEERVFWPLGDVLRRGPKTPAIEPSQPEAVEIAPELAAPAWPSPPEASADGIEPAKRFRTPFGGRIDTTVREAGLVLGTVAVAIGVGIGVATLLGNSGDPSQGSSIVHRPASAQTPAAAPATAGGPATLHGVVPDFKASDSASGATAKADTPATAVAKTNSKPSSIPPGLADSAAAIKTARDFSGAFVLYEIGKTNAKVREAFRATATPRLASALADRPPRLPSNTKVPTAKVQNIVLGTRQGKQIEASVSLLRLGTLSELRLTLVRKKDAWLVSEVRG